MEMIESALIYVPKTPVRLTFLRAYIFGKIYCDIFACIYLWENTFSVYLWFGKTLQNFSSFEYIFGKTHPEVRLFQKYHWLKWKKFQDVLLI